MRLRFAEDAVLRDRSGVWESLDDGVELGKPKPKLNEQNPWRLLVLFYEEILSRRLQLG